MLVCARAELCRAAPGHGKMVLLAISMHCSADQATETWSALTADSNWLGLANNEAEALGTWQGSRRNDLAISKGQVCGRLW